MIEEQLQLAKDASFDLQGYSVEQVNSVLLSLADAICANKETLLEANSKDLARMDRENPLYDRLQLTDSRLEAIASDMRSVVKLQSPLGRVLSETTLPNGLQIKRTSVPFGVIGIVYEARPNVTFDVFSLCLKSGNVCVLRSGRDAFRTADAIVNAMRSGLKKLGLPETFINLIQDTSRQSATELMTADDCIDMLIPRGGRGLIRACVENATVPCIQTGTGICHIYVDESADQEMALRIIENAKTSRPSVCNAEEVLLVAESIAGEFLPKIKKILTDERAASGRIPVELRLCEKASKIIDGIPAGEEDFDTEFLDYILAVKIVKDVKEAVAHISGHSTKHSEAIVTGTPENADYFTGMVDSACVYVNTSTRFTDGGEFGLGCEMGISTQKLHARGPMGLNELTTYKYIIRSEGCIR